MVQINFARKEINCKLVYYGPGLSGKTTNLEMVHARTPQTNRGELTSISTDGDRTLFFDFMPLDLGEIAGMKTKFHLYTVPGQVYYNSTRKLVLLGSDGVIFVADSSRAQLKENLESLANLRENLLEMGKDFGKFPIVIQWNKRDVADAMTVAELAKELNPLNFPAFEAVANKGDGVFPTLKALSQLVLANINSAEQGKTQGGDQKKADEKPADSKAAPGAKSAPSAAPAAAAKAGGGMKIERNEINVPAGKTAPTAAPKAPALEPALSAAARGKSGPSGQTATMQRPPVASNPLDELGGPRNGQKPAAPKAAAPFSSTAERSRSSLGAPAQPPATADGRLSTKTQSGSILLSELQSGGMSTSSETGSMKRPPDGAWSQDGRNGDVFRREVRIIGGRPGGAPVGHMDSKKIMTIGVVCGVVAAVIALILFKVFVG